MLVFSRRGSNYVYDQCAVCIVMWLHVYYLTGNHSALGRVGQPVCEAAELDRVQIAGDRFWHLVESPPHIWLLRGCIS